MIRNLALALALVCVCTTPSLSYTPSSPRMSSNSACSRPAHAAHTSRRTLLLSPLALLLPLPSLADEPSLFEQFGTDAKTIKQTPKSTTTEKVMVPKSAGAIDPNLRANYYYPTARKRYLPRIKRASDEISSVPDAVAEGRWDEVSEFCTKVRCAYVEEQPLKMVHEQAPPLRLTSIRLNNVSPMVQTAEDTILPMKLYTSSLNGQGLNLKVSSTNTMLSSAEEFDKQTTALKKAAKVKDVEKSTVAIQKVRAPSHNKVCRSFLMFPTQHPQMSTALLAYRTAGSLLGPDGGGDIPSVEDIRRSACRVQGRSFERKIQERDARMGGVGSQAVSVAEFKGKGKK